VGGEGGCGSDSVPHGAAAAVLARCTGVDLLELTQGPGMPWWRPGPFSVGGVTGAALQAHGSLARDRACGPVRDGLSRTQVAPHRVGLAP
jgi:hypothetical protein